MIAKIITWLKGRFSPYGEFEDSEEAWLEVTKGTKPGEHNAFKHFKTPATRALIEGNVKNGKRYSEQQLKALGFRKGAS